MSLAWATRTRWVMCPLMSSPRMSCARARAASGSSASFTPPALPRPPVLTWAFTTTGPAISCAIVSACSGLSATPPGRTGTPWEARTSRAWYSNRSTRRHRIPHRACGAPRATAGSGARGGSHVRAHPLDDLCGRGPRGEDPGDAQPLELRDVLVRDDPATEDDDVVDAALAQQLGEPGEQGHVRTGKHGESDGVGVLLDDGLHDLLRGLVQIGRASCRERV